MSARRDYLTDFIILPGERCVYEGIRRVAPGAAVPGRRVEHCRYRDRLEQVTDPGTDRRNRSSCF